LQNGADKTIKNNEGSTPEDLAEDEGVIAMLLE